MAIEKFSILLGYLFFMIASTGNAKFSSEIKYDPCQEIELKITACKNHSESNEQHINDLMKRVNEEHKKLLLQSTIRLDGSKIDGEIKAQRPIRCYQNHEIMIEREDKIPMDQAKFFVTNADCSKLKTGSLHRFIHRRSYCDTPGALELESCFRASLRNLGTVLEHQSP